LLKILTIVIRRKGGRHHACSPDIPLSYAIVPNSLQLSQFIMIFERVTDSVPTDQVDWGFKVTQLVGIDYRYTAAKGWFSDQLLKHNNHYGGRR
jgi:hypothetical protein